MMLYVMRYYWGVDTFRRRRRFLLGERSRVGENAAVTCEGEVRLEKEVRSEKKHGIFDNMLRIEVCEQVNI